MRPEGRNARTAYGSNWSETVKAIVVKYFGPSNTKGSRLRVSAEGVPSMTVSYDHGAHNPKLDAAQAFCAKHDWNGELVEGTLPDGDAVFVFGLPDK